MLVTFCICYFQRANLVFFRGWAAFAIAKKYWLTTVRIRQTLKKGGGMTLLEKIIIVLLSVATTLIANRCYPL